MTDTDAPLFQLTVRDETADFADSLGLREIDLHCQTSEGVSYRDVCTYLAKTLSSAADLWKQELADEIFDGDTTELDWIDRVFHAPATTLEQLEHTIHDALRKEQHP